MSTKGKHPRSDDKNAEASLTGRDKKRAKNFAQRNIDTQPSPSSSSLSTGPRAIDVVDFAESRSFEINAMESALERAAKGGNRRIFQTLPRHLRRRAASHNVKRLPKKLRAHAEKEMELDGTAKPKANRGKKRRPGTVAEEYLRRQGTKNWLETHIWHAKRMHMQERWGYKIPESSQEKSVRAAYRAGQTACLAHDASYFGVTEISGMEDDLVKLLDSHLDPTAPSIGSARFRTGKRISSNYMYGHLGYPLAGIAPVTLLWRPEAGDISEQPQRRTLWIWTHPSSHRTVVESLKSAVQNTEIRVTDLQSELLTFELTGPKSHHILQSILTLSKSSDANLNSTAHSTWETLRCLRSSSSLPPGTVLGLCIQDPRLDFPQKVEWNPSGPTPEEEAAMQKLLVYWPENAAACSIWDAEKRSSTISNRPTEQALNNRRREMLIPGTKLTPNESDVNVPILLIQRNGAIDGTDKANERSEALNGWNIVVPKGWGMAIWKSLVFGGARTAGQVERRQVHFEAGLPCFPYDFPGSAAYDEYMRVEVEKSTALYMKKPPAKRPNYAKLKVDSPFAAPFMSLVNLAVEGAENVELEDAAHVQEEDAMSMDDEDERSGTERMGATTIAKVDPAFTQQSKNDTATGVWLLTGPKLLSSLREPNPSAIADDLDGDIRVVTETMNDRLVEVTKTKGIKLGGSLMTCERFCRAVVRVRITLLGRGVPGPNGIVYLPDREEFEMWEKRLRKKKWEETEHDQNDMDRIPPTERIIGYLTSGQFSFTQGCGYALGCCSAVGIRRLLATEANEMRSIKLFVLVRGITGRVPRPARIQIIS